MEDAKHPKYTFEVHMDANKFDIAEEVAELYGVEVESVRTMVARGKKRTRYTKKGIQRGKQANYKKAIVSLKDGFVIDFYKNI